MKVPDGLPDVTEHNLICTSGKDQGAQQRQHGEEAAAAAFDGSVKIATAADATYGFNRR